MAHYYHFIGEDVFGGLAALHLAEQYDFHFRKRRDGLEPEGRSGNASEAPGGPGRLIIPWVEGWRDVPGLNERLAGALFDEGELGCAGLGVDIGYRTNAIGNLSFCDL